METLSVKHHPDIRWVVIVSVAITALVVGSLAYISTSKKETTSSNITTIQAEKFSELKQKVENLQKINENLQEELKAKTYIPPAADGGITII